MQLIDKKDRLSALIEHYANGNKAEFARKLGISPQAISTWISRNSFDIDIIYAKCEGVSSDWLLTGEPPMLKSELAPANLSGDKNMIPAHVTTAINIERKHDGIPLIPIDAIAGFPDTDTPGITIEDCDHYIIPEFRSLKVEFLIRVSGSSMYPKYSNGDILACRKVKSSGFLQWGKVYVLDTEQGALVKRLFEDRDNPDCIICHSDNTERYPDFKIPKVEIRSYSIVVGAIRVE